MKKTLVTLALVALSGAALAQPVGYPGINWSVLTLNPGVIRDTGERDNMLLQGNLEQGVDWVHFGEGNRWRFTSYGSLGYSVDRAGLDYNNKLVPAVGVKISRSYDNGVVDLGVQAVHERHFRSNRSGTGVQAYASYWFGWDLKK